MNILVGYSGKAQVYLDLEVLLRTRLLIQANSGGGKSFLLRRLAEQLFGKVQVIIIDPEGEFSTLREKYGYVLVGQGGETSADIRSAGLVAEKLMELKASAVCDLFEAFRKNPQGRHTWVKNFCNALLDAPKKYWHPLILIIDEFHKFVPEKGYGESEASESVIGIGTAGRKRGICLVGATQKLAKVRKDVSGELLNRLIGPTFEDVDLDRAADLLSVLRADRAAFFEQMRILEPGNFWALGRAISKARILVKIGPVRTSHPDVNTGKYALVAPPTPQKVKALLPKLGDLPKEAEERQQTIQALQAEVRSLKAQLRTVKVETKEVVKTQIPKDVLDYITKLKDVVEQYEKWRDAMVDFWNKLFSMKMPTAPVIKLPKKEFEKYNTVPESRPSFIPNSRPLTPIAKLHTPDAKKGETDQRTGSHSDLKNPEQRILNAIAWFESIGIDLPEQSAVAFLAGYRYGGGAFNNPRGALRTKGLVEYHGDRIKLTDAGRQLAVFPEETLTDEALHEKVLSRLSTPERRLLKPLLAAYPEALTNEELLEASGYNPGGAFNNPRGRLRTLGLIEYLPGSQVRARSLLFPSNEPRQD
jgi:hypothetical protein